MLLIKAIIIFPYVSSQAIFPSYDFSHTQPWQPHGLPLPVDTFIELIVRLPPPRLL